MNPESRVPAGIALEWWLAGALLVLVQAGLISALFTPAPHPGGDNAAYLTLGYALSQGSGYTELWAPGAPPHTKYPPVFPGLLALLMLGGAATWGAFKVVMGLLMSFAGILVFAWAGGRRGALAGLGVALLTLLSAGWLDASRWILSEPLFLVLVFVTLWAGDQALRRPRGSDGVEESEVRDGSGSRVDSDDSAGSGSGWWAVVAGCAAVLALFTRSAGLPLVLALTGALVLKGRWRAGSITGGVAAVLGGLWFLRARTDADGAYQSEFWMVNPYNPELGTIGLMGLPVRLASNLSTYVGRVIPGEWWGDAGSALLVLGVGLTLLALAGWLNRMRELDSIGVAELFLPVYAGLILVWPEVWAGGRFMLPLYPLLLLYAGEAVVSLGSRTNRIWVPAAASAALALMLGVPAVMGALETADQASACRSTGAADPFRCLGAPLMEFRDAAGWAGEYLPEGAIVLNRKPRIFRALGGTPGVTFPFTRDPEVFLAEADAAGADFLLVDAVDGISVAYLPVLLERAPGAFCWIAGWGDYTDLLRILPPDRRGGTEILSCAMEGAADLRPTGDRHRIPIL